MAVKRIIIGSTGIESSILGSNARSTAKGVSSVISMNAVSSRVTISHTTSSAIGIMTTEASPLYHSAYPSKAKNSTVSTSAVTNPLCLSNQPFIFRNL